MPKKQIKGQVVSNKMAKTVVVAVTRLKEHPKYRKRYRITTRYKAHVDNQSCDVGDIVLLQECRPFSRDKRWRVVKNLTKSKKTEEVLSGSDESDK